MTLASKRLAIKTRLLFPVVLIDRGSFSSTLLLAVVVIDGRSVLAALLVAVVVDEDMVVPHAL